MTHQTAWLAIPMLIGLSQPVLWQMNLRVAKYTGEMESAVILHLVGTVVGLLCVAGGLRVHGFSGLGAIPWWAWLAGAIGVIGMAAMNKAIPHIGVATALAITVAAQLLAALVFEHFGWMGAHIREAVPSRLPGAGLLAIGAWLVTR